MLTSPEVLRRIASKFEPGVVTGALCEAAKDIETLIGGLQAVREVKLPTLFPDKEDMPKDPEDAYRLAWEQALTETRQLAEQTLFGADVFSVHQKQQVIEKLAVAFVEHMRAAPPKEEIVTISLPVSVLRQAYELHESRLSPDMVLPISSLYDIP